MTQIITLLILTLIFTLINLAVWYMADTEHNKLWLIPILVSFVTALTLHCIFIHSEKHNDKTEIALNTAGLCVSLAILLIIIGVILLTNPECTTVALWLIIPSAIAGIASILNLVFRLICFKNTKKGKAMRNEIDNLLNEILMNTDI